MRGNFAAAKRRLFRRPTGVPASAEGRARPSAELLIRTATILRRTLQFAAAIRVRANHWPRSVVTLCSHCLGSKLTNHPLTAAAWNDDRWVLYGTGRETLMYV